MRFRLIPASNPGPYTGPGGNNTYLLQGREPALIDAGTGVDAHLDAVDEALAGAPLARVLVTHGHSDHASGAAALARRWPSVEFLKLPWPDVDGRWGVPWSRIRAGDTIRAGDAVLRAIHTPGHAPDHLCFYEDATRTLFAGDLFVDRGTVVIPASRGGDLAQYLDSLQRILALDPDTALPAHGGPIERPADVIRRYLVHRRERDEQIVAALVNGDRTPDAIVARVYAGLPAELASAARETVTAHLAKLEHEGRVRHEAGEWRLAGARP
jgi:glyoxylase-like metal-dependent hydrolase (beta-lactamase superfamily II)